VRQRADRALLSAIRARGFAGCTGLLIATGAALAGCAGHPSRPPAPAPAAASRQPVEAESLRVGSDAAAESLLVDVRSLDPAILVDLRYATTNNFTGAVLPGYEAQKALLRREAAQALARVEARLRTGGLGLRIWDAYRPVRATRAMVVWAERTGRTDLLDQEYIARRSRHNLGVAVDLTLVDLVTGTELDMGTPFDTFTEAAHTANAQGRILRYRQILVRAMESEGFQNYENEWWHFAYPVVDARPFDLPIR
jgi:D-alanyl-D-alanine dipeptidase